MRYIRLLRIRLEQATRPTTKGHYYRYRNIMIGRPTDWFYVANAVYLPLPGMQPDKVTHLGMVRIDQVVYVMQIFHDHVIKLTTSPLWRPALVRLDKEIEAMIEAIERLPNNRWTMGQW
jgi:hypothetical protein